MSTKEKRPALVTAPRHGTIQHTFEVRASGIGVTGLFGHIVGRDGKSKYFDPNVQWLWDCFCRAYDLE